MQHGQEKKKKQPTKLCVNTFPVSGDGAYAVLTHMNVSVLSCLIAATRVWTVTDSRKRFVLQMLFLFCVNRTKSVPGTAVNRYSCWLAALEASAKL